MAKWIHPFQFMWNSLWVSLGCRFSVHRCKSCISRSQKRSTSKNNLSVTIFISVSSYSCQFWFIADGSTHLYSSSKNSPKNQNWEPGLQWILRIDFWLKRFGFEVGSTKSTSEIKTEKKCKASCNFTSFIFLIHFIKYINTKWNMLKRHGQERLR